MDTDYFSAPLSFRVRKVLRYARLYGPVRTATKIRAQYHARRSAPPLAADWVNDRCGDPDATERTVGIIGCGSFAYSTIAYYCAGPSSRFLRSTYDIDGGRARSLCRDYGGARAVATADDLIHDERIRLVFIASNHASHADYAVRCLVAGKHVHIEKPHVVRHEQLDSLLDAMARNPAARVFLGFNRPRSPHVRVLMDTMERQEGPWMINWFIAGHQIPEHHWYFAEAEGGRVLGNLCHWTDLSLHLVGLDRAFPATIVPACPQGSRSDFAVTMVFADGSVASITFSAKGHAFEGVKEVLHVHRGDAIASLRDFAETRVDVLGRRQTYRTLVRDHGHKANVLNSLRGASSGGHFGETPRHVRATAELFLAAKHAVESGIPVAVPGS